MSRFLEINVLSIDMFYVKKIDANKMIIQETKSFVILSTLKNVGKAIIEKFPRSRSAKLLSLVLHTNRGEKSY